MISLYSFNASVNWRERERERERERDNSEKRKSKAQTSRTLDNKKPRNPWETYLNIGCLR